MLIPSEEVINTLRAHIKGLEIQIKFEGNSYLDKELGVSSRESHKQGLEQALSVVEEAVDREMARMVKDHNDNPPYLARAAE